MTGAQEPREPLEPVWAIAANVVLWRRYGEGGQGQRPGTKRFTGGSKVYVCAWTGERARALHGRGPPPRDVPLRRGVRGR